MFTEEIIAAFGNAAMMLSKNAPQVGLTSNGLRILNFALDIDSKKVPFSAIEQNPNRLSEASSLKKRGHNVVQIRDNSVHQLVGFIDLTDKRFTMYGASVASEEIDDVEKYLGREAFQPGDIVMSVAPPSVPSEPEFTRGRRKRAA